MNVEPVLIVPTGTSNTASIRASFRRLGVDARLCLDANSIRDAQHAVLPGVGSFGAAMRALEAGGFAEPLRARLQERRPTLAICLGMQLLCASSDESPTVPGLAMIDSVVQRLPADQRVPQIGWNRVIGEFETEGFGYFANSYGVSDAPADWRCAYYVYGNQFVAEMRSGDVWACQFHPEISGAWGQTLLSNWLNTGNARSASC